MVPPDDVMTRCGILVNVSTQVVSPDDVIYVFNRIEG